METIATCYFSGIFISNVLFLILWVAGMFDSEQGGHAKYFPIFLCTLIWPIFWVKFVMMGIFKTFTCIHKGLWPALRQAGEYLVS